MSAIVQTYTMTMENNRYVVRNNDGLRMGSARTKPKAQHLIDTLSMLADQSSRVIREISPERNPSHD